MKFHLYLSPMPTEQPYSQVQQQRVSLADHADWVALSLMAAGHEVRTSDRICYDDDVINLFFEGFWPNPPATILFTHARFGIIVLEAVKPDGSGWLNAEGWRNVSLGERQFIDNTSAHWHMRWVEFQRLAPAAEFIWCLVPETVGHVAHHAPTAHFELGYLPQLAFQPSTEPLTDFCFFGTSTAKRQELVMQLCERGFRTAAVITIVPQAQRNQMIAETKVVLSPALYQLPIPSVTRIGRALHGQRAVAFEACENVIRPASFLEAPRPGEPFIDYACRIVSDDPIDRGHAAWEQYQREMPAAEIAERIIGMTIKDPPEPVAHRHAERMKLRNAYEAVLYAEEYKTSELGRLVKDVFTDPKYQIAATKETVLPKETLDFLSSLRT